MKRSRLTRLIELLTLLQTGPGHNTRTLAEVCHVSRRTVFRDLEVLRRAGVRLAFDEEHQRFYLPGASILPPTSFSTEEALSLILLCYELGDQNGLPFFGAARSAAIKLESGLPQPLRDHLRQNSPAVEIKLPPHNALTGKQSVYSRLLAATTDKRAVRIRYRSPAEAGEICTKLSPYRMLFSQRSWYVIGRSSLHRQVRTFHLGRIRQLEALDDTFTVPRGFSLSRYLRNAWRLIPERGRDVDVLIRFQPLVARNVFEVTWHKTQKAEFNDDGSLDFQVRVSGIHEIAWWVLGYGDQAEVIKPAALRELVARHAQRMAAQYRPELRRLRNGRAKREKLKPH